MSREYRVVWKREGLRRTTAIRQTREGADAKAARLRGEFEVTVDAGVGVSFVPGDAWLDDQGVPPLEYLHIESREVGPWVADGDSDRYGEWTDDEWKQAQARVANRADGDSEPEAPPIAAALRGADSFAGEPWTTTRSDGDSEPGV